MQTSKTILPLKHDKKEYSKQWQTKQLAIPTIKLKYFVYLNIQFTSRLWVVKWYKISFELTNQFRAFNNNNKTVF